MRRSTQKYIPTASNHVYAIKYNQRDRILTVKFHNKAVYEYLNVEVGVYEAMLQSRSHGCFLWDHIRGKYHFRKLKPNEDKSAISSIICPEQEKLNSLDDNEEELTKEFRKGLISKEEHTNLLNVIKTKRERLMKKLEKDGYFSEELEEEFDEQGENYSVVGLVINALGKSFTLAFKVLFICFGVFFGLMGALMR
jgi:hypothetical protein